MLCNHANVVEIRGPAGSGKTSLLAFAIAGASVWLSRKQILVVGNSREFDLFCRALAEFDVSTENLKLATIEDVSLRPNEVGLVVALSVKRFRDDKNEVHYSTIHYDDIINTLIERSRFNVFVWAQLQA